MSLYNWLMQERTKEQLAKELAQTAKDKAALQNEVFLLQHELFWMKATKENRDEHY